LRPFFVSRDYTLYSPLFKHRHALFPDPAGPKAHPSPAYPLARRAFKEDNELEFFFTSLRVWPVRDAEGRYVVIKLVSSRTPSEELQILQKLDTAQARADPRNHTIYVLDYVFLVTLSLSLCPGGRWPLITTLEPLLKSSN